MLTGLVSVTFRKLSYKEIIKIVKEAGLGGVEWGSDIHCPPGDAEAAREIAALSSENGIAVISYGSYYKAGSFSGFDDLLRSAEILKTKNIRVWAGDIASKAADAEHWRAVAEDTKRIADMAAGRGMSVSFEYHHDTLTDDIDSTMRLLGEAGRDNVFTYWQPPEGSSAEENVRDLKRLSAARKLKNMHAYSMDGSARMPFDFKRGDWKKYIVEAPRAGAVLLEFVKGDDVSQFLEDARALNECVKESQND